MNVNTNYHVLRVKFLPQTNTLAHRVQVSSELFDQSLVFSWEQRNADERAFQLAARKLQEKGFEIVGSAEGKNCIYLISTTFQELTK